MGRRSTALISANLAQSLSRTQAYYPLFAISEGLD